MATCPGKPACGSDRTTDANLTQRNAWTLDKLGNWDEFVKRTNNTTITEPRTNNEANEYLTIDPDGSGGASPIDLVFDDNGNLKDDGTYLYDYDIENRMTRVQLKSGPELLADYQYDALGRRIRKIIPSGQPDAGTWTYAINEQWQVLSEYHMAPEEEEALPVREYCQGGPSAYVDDHVAMFNIYIDGLEWSEQWYWYHTDAQFCTLAMTNAIGAIAERYVTDPYGKAVTYNGSWGSPQATSRLGNPFMHQGLWLDGECGKYQNRNREYLPALGRFGQRDPLDYVEGENLYGAYAQDPLVFADPNGTFCGPPGSGAPIICGGKGGIWDFDIVLDGEVFPFSQPNGSYLPQGPRLSDFDSMDAGGIGSGGPLAGPTATPPSRAGDATLLMP